MRNQSSNQDSWWHERPTKIGDLPTGYQTIGDVQKRDKSVWVKAAVVVGLMLALIVSLVSMATR